MKVTEQIENYENLTAEEKLAALEGLEVDTTKNDYEKDIAKYKDLMQKANSQAADYKKQLQAKQTEDEKREAERAEKEAEKDALLKSLIRERDMANYKAEFGTLGFSEELAGDSANKLIDGDMKSVFANFKNFLTERDKAVKAEILKSSPKPIPGGNDDKTITKEQFKAMGYSEKVKLATENPTLYEQLKS